MSGAELHPATGGLLPGSLNGRYHVVAELGDGVQSRVVRAYDAHLHRDVAIKVFPVREVAAGGVDGRPGEGQLLASLNHRALTTLYEAGTDRTDPDEPLGYLVMEYVQGPDLRERLRAGSLTPQQVCWLGYDLGDALDHLHRAGFLHRDVKPANVLLTERQPGVRLRAKLIDFGISAPVRTAHIPGRVTGTAAYLAPEQVEDRPPTETSDVYALGLVLIEAITGVAAFPGNEQESAFARLDRQPEVPEHLPPPLTALLSEMTARRAAARPTPGRAAGRFRALALGLGLGLEEAAGSPDPVGSAAGRESARLAAMRRYHILDTPPEDAFDDLTALAAHLLHTPAAVLAITDRDRVWFKSRHDVTEQQIDRDSALCTLTATDDGPWTVRDAAEDPRTWDSPLVTRGPRVRGYAAAPLRTHDGHSIGTFCVLDPRPHDFTDDDLAILASLAAVVMRELELRLASRRVIFNRRTGGIDGDEGSRWQDRGGEFMARW